MHTCRFKPRLVDLIAPKVSFFGLFCETLEARLVQMLRGDVNALVFACERVPGVVPCSPGPRGAKTCFLPVTGGNRQKFVVARGVLRPAGQGGLIPSSASGWG